MADLLDIAPSTAVAIVTVNDRRIKVSGVSIDAIASIVARFPELRSLFNGGAGGDIVPRLIAGCGAAVGPIIAAGCGHSGEEEYEQRAARLLPEQQLKFVRAIFGLTFPNGFDPFIKELAALIGGGNEGAAKIVKMRLKKSPSVSPPSSDAASRPTMQ